MSAATSSRSVAHACSATNVPPSGEPHVAVVETHTSILVFVGDLVYKGKKPVTFPFLDLSTPAERLENCRRELELNRLVAPDVYLGLSELRPLYLPGAIGEPLLVMRRMPRRRRLSTILDRGEDADRWLADVARQVAALHGRELPLEGFGLARTMRALWREGREQLIPFEGSILPTADLDAVSALAEEYLDGRVALLDERERSGFVRAGHGDLLSEDIFCLDDGARILDCLEFDERLRGGDVVLDAAFLAMDLEAHGHADAGRRFLERYERLERTAAPASLVDHYIAYRAFVRAKVESLRSGQGAAGALGAARDLLTLCRHHLDAARVHLVLLGGLPGSGKSSVAAALDTEDPSGRQWMTLSSDVVRKELAGRQPLVSAAAPYRTGLYTEARTQATYAELLRRAAAALAGGMNVVLDASWSDGLFRLQARELAADAHVALTEARCEAPLDVCAHRLGVRAISASDADPAVLAAIAADAAPWPEAHPVPTATTPAAAARIVQRLLEAAPQPTSTHQEATP